MRITLNAISGFAFGVALTLVSLLAAGGGHGTYVPLRFSSAPLGNFGAMPALIGTLGLWAMIGMLFDPGRSRWRRRVIVSILVIHYCSAVFFGVRENDLNYLFEGSLPLQIAFVIWLITYGLGQVVVWRNLNKQRGE